jgi:hypothetical protein
MFRESVDIDRRRADLAQLTAECIEVKRALRSTWTRPMADEQRRHARLRRNITERLVLLALLRSKLHVIHPPRDAGEPWDAAVWNAKVAERIAPAYARAAPAEARVQ